MQLWVDRMDLQSLLSHILKVWSSIDKWSIGLFFILLVGLIVFTDITAQSDDLADQSSNRWIDKGHLEISAWENNDEGKLKTLSLEGDWLFSLSDDLSYKDPVYDDSSWDAIHVPSNWMERPEENKVYGWYRLHLKLPEEYPDSVLGIELGWIDDVDETYFNGYPIGKTGIFDQEDPSSGLIHAYDKTRIYGLPSHLINLGGDNLLAVRVKSMAYDTAGIYSRKQRLGSLSELKNNYFNRQYLIIILAGIYGIVALYFGFLFYKRPKTYENLFFSLFAFFISLLTILRGEIKYFIIQDFHLLKFAEYQIESLLVMSFAHFLIYQFEHKFFTLLVKILDAVLILSITILSFLYYDVAGYIGFNLYFRMWFILASILFLLSYLIVYVIKGDKNARLMLGGGVILAVFMVMDIVVDVMDMTDFPFIGQYGFLAFVLSIAGALGNNFVELYNKSRDLSQKLTVFSKELEQKNIELTKLNELKDEFLANTSHELRTPLNGIVGISESLIDGAAGPLNTQQLNNLNMIVLSGKRLTTLVNDILDFSKLKHQSIELKISSLDMKSLTDVVIMLLNPLIGDKEVAVYNRIPENCPPVKADENRMQQIMQNLIGNAIKFTDKGKVEISAKPEGEYLKVSISDTGIGIPEDKLDVIFESFQQADGSISRKYSGTGLGLTITRELIELHKGQIQVESILGSGSIFSFTIPLSREATQPIHPIKKMNLNAFRPANIHLSHMENKPSALPEIISENKRIMIVDDEPVNVQVLVNHLSLEGYQVYTAEDGKSALDIIHKEDCPDVMLLDIMMPKMSGYEVCRIIRESYSIYDLPILMLTAKNQIVDIVAGFEAGANDYLTKPFDKSELLARVKTLLTLKQTVKDHNQLTEIQKELDIANRIFKSILPENIPISDSLDIGIQHTPIASVGGDFYDFIQHPNNNLGVLIADVSGHGIPAALIAAMVKIAFSMEHRVGDDTVRVLQNINQSLLGKCGSNFITAGYAYFDMENKTLKYSSAGHPPMILLKKKKNAIEKLKPQGTIIGYIPDIECQFSTISLNSGDRIILYTDGVTESRNIYGDEFDENHFIELIKKEQHRSAKNFTEYCIQYLKEWTQREEGFEDDLTLIVVDVI